MTQQEYENKIKELQDELEKLKAAKIADSGKRWKPNKYETYWLVDNCGGAGEVTWQNGDYDKWHYLTGNCFKTKKEAEEYKKQIEYTARYKNYIEEHSEPLDWNNLFSHKYCVEFISDENEFKVSWYSSLKNQGTIYASSEKIIRDAIREIGEDNFKKYVLGVK